MSFKGKTVAITGACGTVGRELVRQVSAAGAFRVICLDNNESELFFLKEDYRDFDGVECYLSDIRDLESLTHRMEGVDVLIHSAAFKHVGLCEDSPRQAIRTNIQGTQNVIDAALAARVGRVLFTSSDKAVNPTNVMGTTKLMGERLMTAAHQSNPKAGTVFASTRFGNVLGSRGSVVPLFAQQIRNGQDVTLTDAEMTRFIMTLEEAVKLVLDSVWLAQGGEVFVTKMPVVRIKDVADYMCTAIAPGKNIRVIEIGAKPGEKMYEELMNDEEVRRTYDIGDFFVVRSAFDDPTIPHALTDGRPKPDRPYNSANETAVTPVDLAAYFVKNKVLAAA